MQRGRGRDGRRLVAVLAHGAGSTADFLRRAFPATALGVDEVIALDDRTGNSTEVTSALDVAVRGVLEAHGSGVVVGGVSLGAHAAATWAAGPGSALAAGRLAGLVLALPAWTDAPDDVAAAAADDVAAQGVSGVLARLSTDPALIGDWVLDELARAWPSYGDDGLAAALRRAGSTPGPGAKRLRSLSVPTAIVSLAEDPLHPYDVAAQWLSLIPHARLAVVPRHDPAAGRDVLGRTAGSLLRDLGVTGG